MAFVKYNTSNRSVGQLLAGISASDTVLQLEAGQGAKFASSNAILSLVQYTVPTDPTSEIVKEEDVLMTSRSTDTFNITRAFGDTSATSFNAGDFLYLNTRSEHIKDLQDETTRLETDKLNITAFNSSLRDNLTSWRTFFTNGSGDETGLVFGSAGRVLQSNGATATPSWEIPSTNITELDEVSNIENNDELIIYRGSNKKITAGTLLNATYQKFIYGETILKGDLVLQDLTDGKVYKWAGDFLTNKEIKGIAQEDGVLNDEKAVIIGGVDRSLTGLTLGDEYYAGYFNATQFDGTTGNAFTGSGYWGVEIFAKKKAEIKGVIVRYSSGTLRVVRKSDNSILFEQAVSVNASTDTGVIMEIGETYEVIANVGSASALINGVSLPISNDICNISQYQGDRYRLISRVILEGADDGEIINIPNKFGIVGKAISDTEILIRRTNIDGQLTTSAGTGGVTLGNAVGYVSVIINGEPKKIPYYN